MLVVKFADLFVMLAIAFTITCDVYHNDQHPNQSYSRKRKPEYSEVSGSGNVHRMNYKISIIESWQNARDRDKSTDVWNCLHDSRCNFVRRHHRKDFPQICTCNGNSDHEICVRINCKRSSAQTQSIKSVCKYDISKSFNYSRTLRNGNGMQQKARRKDNMSEIIPILQKVGIKDYDSSVCVDDNMEGIYEDDKEHISNPKNQSQSIIISLDRYSIVAPNVITTKIVDIMNKCSKKKICPVFVNRKKRSSILLCVLLHGQSFCVVLKCKSYPKPNDTDLAKHPPLEKTTSLEAIWTHWKEKILLVCTGVVLLSGLMGFVIGVHFPCYRKAKTTKKHNTKSLSASLNSELYAEICEASNDTVKGPEQSRPDQAQLDGMSFNRDYRHEKSKSEYGYSHVYNTLQRNYGTKRNSHQDLISLKTLEMPYSCHQYRSLQTLSDQNLIQGRMSRVSV